MIPGYVEQDYEKSCANCKFRAWLYLKHKYSIHCMKQNPPQLVRNNGVCPKHEHNICSSCRYSSFDDGCHWCNNTKSLYEGLVSPEDKACKKWRKLKELCK